MFGRTLKISIAKNNGRATEFNTKRTYSEAQKCFECGQDGHLSYKCPSNVLGNREIPQKKSNHKNKHPITPNYLETERCDVDDNDGTNSEVCIIFIQLFYTQEIFH